MQQIGVIYTKCDYPGCEQHVVTPIDGDQSALDEWATVTAECKEKDLCPDHYQAYVDWLEEFWDVPTGKHSMTETDKLAEMLEVDNSVVEPELKDEDILYTNMPGMVTVISPAGTVNAHVDSEEW